MKKAVAFACVLALLPVLTAQEPKTKPAKPPIETFTDPAKAGRDYQVQGEYVGEMPDGTKIGAQVVADGDGKFSGKSYRGGLPGDGFDGQETWKHQGDTVNGVASVEGGEGKGEFANGKMMVTLNSGEKFTLERVTRKSPTEGMKPPAGAVVLFDGSSADRWEKGQLVEKNLLKMGTTSKQAFGDCTLHLEFRTPFMPRARGQARGNSGVYLQGRYEVQILDSFGLEGKDNECGGLYELSDPAVNMCYPPLQWQTYDIDFTAARFDATGKKTANARISVKHNGVVIQDNVELKRDTKGGPNKEGPGTGPLYLQDHGNPVYYRNVWLVKKK